MDAYMWGYIDKDRLSTSGGEYIWPQFGNSRTRQQQDENMSSFNSDVGITPYYSGISSNSQSHRNFPDIFPIIESQSSPTNIPEPGPTFDPISSCLSGPSIEQAKLVSTASNATRGVNRAKKTSDLEDDQEDDPEVGPSVNSRATPKAEFKTETGPSHRTLGSHKLCEIVIDPNQDDLIGPIHQILLYQALLKSPTHQNSFNGIYNQVNKLVRTLQSQNWNKAVRKGLKRGTPFEAVPGQPDQWRLTKDVETNGLTIAIYHCPSQVRQPRKKQKLGAQENEIYTKPQVTLGPNNWSVIKDRTTQQPTHQDLAKETTRREPNMNLVMSKNDRVILKPKSSIRTAKIKQGQESI